jgi:hypothetical protein
MKHIKFTYVDVKTGVSVAKAPAKNGPVFPAITGLQFIRARESQYPTNVPQFYGTCDDEADTRVEGVLSVMTPEAWLAEVLGELKVQATAKRFAVMAGGIEVGGILIGTTDQDQARMSQVVVGAPLAGLTDESEVSFKAASGFVRATIGQIKAIVGAIGLHWQACFAAEEAHWNAIDALTTPEEINAYNVNAGWPNETSPI